MQTIMHNPQDNLISAKILQAFQANKSQCLIFLLKVSDQVVLSTMHCRQEIRAGDPTCIAKFMPHFDGPFHSRVLMENILQLPWIYWISQMFSLFSTHWRFAPSQKTMTLCISLSGTHTTGTPQYQMSTRILHWQNHQWTKMWKENPLPSVLARRRPWKWFMATEWRTYQLWGTGYLNENPQSYNFVCNFSQTSW